MGNNVNWWEEETDQRFKKRAQCIIEQYGNYTVPENGLKVKLAIHKNDSKIKRLTSKYSSFAITGKWHQHPRGKYR